MNVNLGPQHPAVTPPPVHGTAQATPKTTTTDCKSLAQEVSSAVSPKMENAFVKGTKPLSERQNKYNDFGSKANANIIQDEKAAQAWLAEQNGVQHIPGHAQQAHAAPEASPKRPLTPAPMHKATLETFSENPVKNPSTAQKNLGARLLSYISKACIFIKNEALPTAGHAPAHAIQALKSQITDATKPLRNEVLKSKIDKSSLMSLEDIEYIEHVVTPMIGLLLNHTPENNHLGVLPSNVNISDIAKKFGSIESSFQKAIAHLDPSSAEYICANTKMNELREVVHYCQQLEARNYKSDIITLLVNFRLDLKHEGISDKFPSSLVNPHTSEEIENMSSENAKNGQLNDAEGVPFGGIRRTGKDDDASITKLFVDFCKKHGGDYDSVISARNGPSPELHPGTYCAQQSQDSWSRMSCIIKERMLNFRNLSANEKEEKFYFAIDYEVKIQDTRQMNLNTVDVTVLMCMALTAEFLEKTTIPGSNSKERTVEVYRTENQTVLENQKIILSKTQNQKIKRGPLESFSTEKPVFIDGNCVTIQHVAFVDVFCSYLLDPFYQNSEREIVCITDNIESKYIEAKSRTEMGKIQNKNNKLIKAEAEAAEYKALADADAQALLDSNFTF